MKKVLLLVAILFSLSSLMSCEEENVTPDLGVQSVPSDPEDDNCKGQQCD